MLFVSAFPALAAAEDGLGAGVNAQAGIGIQAGGSDEGSSDAPSSEGRGDSGMHIQGDSMMNATGSVESSSHRSEQGSENRGESMGAGGDHESAMEDMNDSDIEIDHESAISSTSTVDTPDKVENRGQLRSFLEHVTKSDEHISDVHVSTTTVETHYDVPAKFLWAIPATLPTQVNVGADGSVTVTYPWYAFLFATDPQLEANLSQSASTTLSGTTTFSASTQAHLLNALFEALRGSSN